MLTFVVDAWFWKIVFSGLWRWTLMLCSPAVLSGAWWCYPPLSIATKLPVGVWINLGLSPLLTSFVDFLASSIFFSSTSYKTMLLFYTHSILLILITLGPKSTRLQSLKLYSHLSNECIVLETSSMDQALNNTIDRIMPTAQGSWIYIDFFNPYQ